MIELDLTPAQEEQMLAFWNATPNTPPSLKDITKHIFGGDFDGRSAEGKAIKKALAKRNIKAKAIGEDPLKMDLISLDENHKAYIVNNAANMTAVEMARILFNNPSLSNLNAETRLVNEHIKTLDSRVIFSQDNTEDVPEGTYEPPKTLDKILRRVNIYINFALDKDRLTPMQKKGLEKLIDYLHTYRFIKQINTYDLVGDRKTFEDAFIRYTYDKPDLTQEEVDQYILLANEVVSSFKIQRRTERLQALAEQSLENTPENAKISIGLTDSISTVNDEHHQCVIRQQKLLDDLKEKRSSRLGKQLKDNASILTLVQLWKLEESREKMLKIAALEQQGISDEVDKLSNMDELKAKIFGPSKNGIKYG